LNHSKPIYIVQVAINYVPYIEAFSLIHILLIFCRIILLSLCLLRDMVSFQC